MATEHPGNLEAELQGQLAWVQRLALTLVRNRDAADDLTQDAAAAWLTRRPEWAARGDGLRGWLARAMRSLAVDRGRAERARRRREDEVGGEARAGAAEATHEIVERLERQRRVIAAVHALPEPYRTTILYRFFDDLPSAAVAARLGVTEATVRKRIERGLALLRDRLDGEFGTRSRVWCVGLLEPGLRQQVEAALVTGGTSVLVQGVGIMGGKWLAGFSAALVVASLAWYLAGTGDPVPDAAVGGHGVVVAASVAAARASPGAAPATPEADPVRAAAPASAPPVRVHGFLFVDGEHRAPPDLAITIAHGERAVALDVAAATWGFLPGGEPATLWITSASTVPAQVPVPRELLVGGGVFDLHLASGRSLALQFVDEVTRAPLTALEFEVSKAIELERGNGRIVSRSGASHYRTDESGRALVTGVPEVGTVQVRVDFAVRERDVLFADGRTMPGRLPPSPVWSCWLSADQPRRLEATIATSPVLGDGTARGQVPGWASGPDGPAAVRAVAREWGKVGTDHNGFGDPFVLPQDERGNVVLHASVPSRHRIWLERRADRAPLSAEVLVTFERPGEQAPLVFTPLAAASLRLRCTNVPASGELEVTVSGPSGAPRSERRVCDGKPFVLDLALVAGQEVRVVLHMKAGERESGWQRQFAAGADPREVVFDLGGSWREIEFAADAVDRSGIETISLLPCRGGGVVVDERVLVACNAGRAQTAVHVPPGRWLYLGAGSQPTVWGIVDVPAAASGVLVLRPRQFLVPAAELRPAIRFDELEGISLQALPESLRVLRPAGDGAVALPQDVVHVRLPK